MLDRNIHLTSDLVHMGFSLERFCQHWGLDRRDTPKREYSYPFLSLRLTVAAPNQVFHSHTTVNLFQDRPPVTTVEGPTRCNS